MNGEKTPGKAPGARDRGAASGSGGGTAPALPAQQGSQPGSEPGAAPASAPNPPGGAAPGQDPEPGPAHRPEPGAAAEPQQGGTASARGAHPSPGAPQLDPPWLSWDLGGPHQVLSWAVNRPGFVTASRILWREVRNDDLTPELDVARWLGDELARISALDAVVMLTSRHVARHVLTRASAADPPPGRGEPLPAPVTARCLTTTGLSNAERIGTRRPPGPEWGTINIAVQISVPLQLTALIEAVSIAAEARTAAVIEAGITLPAGTATGTGTDCIAIAAPAPQSRPGIAAPLPHAGLHTAVGEALGRAVYEAVRQGCADWLAGPGRALFPARSQDPGPDGPEPAGQD